jgi:FixJ family two-component response regulator
MPPDSPRPKAAVLVIDDDSDVLASLKFALEVDGLSVEVFASAEDVLRTTALADAACLVVDFWLPGRDGLELIAMLRAKGLDTPAFLMTTDPPHHIRLRAEEAGVAIVEKPLLGNTLAELIRSAVEK